MRTSIVWFCLLCAQGLWEADGAKILGLFTVPSISHQVVYRALMKELHSRGHELVVFTPDPIRDPNLKNYREIDLSASYEIWRRRFSGLTKTREGGSSAFSQFNMILEFVYAGLDLCQVELTLPEVRKFIKENKIKFDIVIAEWIMSPCFAVVPYMLKAPMIGITSLPPSLGTHRIVGNPIHPAYMPEILLGYTDHPTFLQRIHSTVHTVLFKLAYHFWIMPLHDEMIRRLFSDTAMPYVEEVVNNVSMVLVNSHFSFYYPRPNVPNMIEIAGLHLSDPKPLPKDLQQFLDGAPEGAIYFSLGTNVRSDSMSDVKRQMFLDVFSELPQLRVLWKWESDDLPGKPSNVRLGKWLPQHDILAHPNMKAFIFQGGLQSTEETIREQVPVIGIPFFADQDLNVRKIVDGGAGIRIDYQDLTKEKLLTALKDLIYNKTYKENMIRLSKIAKDQPESPMERAVWWTEYVIRHKGAPHLRSAAVDLTWYQILLLDVIAFLALISGVTVWVTCVIARLIKSTVRSLTKPRTKCE